MALKLFILNNGREVIGKHVERDPSFGEGLWIDTPRILHFSPTPDGTSYGIELYPYSMTNPDGTHRFHFSAIASESETVPVDIEKGYIQQTSNISIVSSLK